MPEQATNTLDRWYTVRAYRRDTDQWYWAEVLAPTRVAAESILDSFLASPWETERVRFVRRAA